jgi:alpha-galactosidase
MTAAWAQYARAGNWPDADMLPLGHIGPVPGNGKPRETRFTPDEQTTLMTLWCMARSPLILGTNLTELDAPTLKLLTNRDVLAVDQMATRSGQVLRQGPVVAWTADLPANFPAGYTRALALFNTADEPITISTSFEAYQIEPATYRIRDAWAQKDLGTRGSIENLSLQPHASILWLLKR